MYLNKAYTAVICLNNAHQCASINDLSKPDAIFVIFMKNDHHVQFCLDDRLLVFAKIGNNSHNGMQIKLSISSVGTTVKIFCG